MDKWMIMMCVVGAVAFLGWVWSLVIVSKRGNDWMDDLYDRMRQVDFGQEDEDVK